MSILSGKEVTFEAQIVSSDGVLITVERLGKFIDFGLKASVDHGGYSPAHGSYSVAIILYKGQLFLVDLEKLTFSEEVN